MGLGGRRGGHGRGVLAGIQVIPALPAVLDGPSIPCKRQRLDEHAGVMEVRIEARDLDGFFHIEGRGAVVVVVHAVAALGHLRADLVDRAVGRDDVELAAAGQVIYEGEFNPVEMRWDADPKGVPFPVIEGTRPLNEPGLPQLPVQDLVLLGQASLLHPVLDGLAVVGLAFLDVEADTLDDPLNEHMRSSIGHLDLLHPNKGS